MNSGEPQTTDSNPEPKMDKVSQDTDDQEEGADSLANGLGQPLLTEVPVGAGIWLSFTLPHQYPGLAISVCSLPVEAGSNDIYSRAVKCLTHLIISQELSTL